MAYNYNGLYLCLLHWVLLDVCYILVVVTLEIYFKLFFSLRSKFPQKDLEMLFPGMSADFTSENFSAAWYLIENHSTTRLVILDC